MLTTIGNFLKENWVDLALIIVGLSALFIYWLQERRKVSEAASLIVMQVEELQKRMREIGTYIVDGRLNNTAFYESQPLYTTDYWDHYKHHFARSMDSFSFGLFDEFYSSAAAVLEQQQLMKNLQKNFFFCTQQMLMQMETNSIMQNLSLCSQNSVDPQRVIDAIMSTAPQTMENEQKAVVEDALKNLVQPNPFVDLNSFWKLYNQSKSSMHTVINQNGYTDYIPQQIKISLENALRYYSSIQIIECSGYRLLKKIAQRKF